jgi:polysaccharide pyruvyl transferase WcaK-like protein
MRILIGTGLNSGEAEYQNVGDIAMLQAAVARLSEFWPEAEIVVLTDSAAGLARFCPRAKPLSRTGAETWVSDRILLGQLHRLLPTSLSHWLIDAKHYLRAKHPAILRGMLHARFRIRDSVSRLEQLDSFLNTLESSDLLLICGSGGFADSCRDWNLFTLGIVESAIAAAVPVALTGQGIGPISDPDVISRMRKVLPRVTLLASRGTHGAHAIARYIGVPEDLFLTTGDETVELAFLARPLSPGSGIGVNLRIAPYSGVSEDAADVIGDVLRSFAASHGANLIPLPIATHSYADDTRTIGRLLDTDPSNFASLDSPQRIFEQTAKCRIVVTGAYHAAVFALSQGIPAICVSASDYYRCKFVGLRSLFGEGCMVVNLHEPDSQNSLSISLQAGWIKFDSLHNDLLEAAQGQIGASRDALRRLRQMFPAEGGLPIRRDSATMSIP